MPIIAGSAGGVCVCFIVAAALLFVKKQQSKRKKHKGELPKDWTVATDPESGLPYYTNKVTGETSWDRPSSSNVKAEREVQLQANPMKGNDQARGESELPAGWSSKLDENGDKYYINDSTGETSWDRPKKGRRGHDRMSTQLPAQWAKGFDENGDKYYFHEETGESSWDAPEGSEGGSSTLLRPGHQASHTIIPDGWERAVTEEGNKYYIQPDGTSQWEKPPGNDE